ncbi:MAG: hypothetical protein M1815_000181 [Lichina confinis]|nr:MAG: hypothetical protein M1815_000181 [Lichina confinis]
MSTKVHSPVANLLRNSRLFSLLPPLPRPTEQVQRTPEMATLPYPTFAAIMTPMSSLGDDNTGDPHWPGGQGDNIVHITKFTSVADTA